jgi:hypothetical protein
MNFSEGLNVKYRNTYGIINFLSEKYLTMTIKNGNVPVNDVNILVYPENWKEIKLIKESEK